MKDIVRLVSTLGRMHAALLGLCKANYVNMADEWRTRLFLSRTVLR